MLGEIWYAIGLIIGIIILIPISIFFVALIGGCLKEILNLTVATANVIATWIDEKLLHKK